MTLNFPQPYTTRDSAGLKLAIRVPKYPPMKYNSDGVFFHTKVI